MAMPIPLLEGRREGGHGLCLSPLEERSGVIVTLIPHPIGRWASGQDFCPSTPEKERGVIMALPIPLQEGTRARGHGLCLSPLEKRRSAVMAILIPHPEARWIRQVDLISHAVLSRSRPL